MRLGALQLFVLFHSAYSFSTGAGDCKGGEPAVGGNHTNRAVEIRQTTLRDNGILVFIDGAPLDPQVSLETKTEYQISVDSGIFGNLRGILMRMEASRSGTTILTDPLQNTQYASACNSYPGAVGLTHSNNTVKKVFSGTFVVNSPDTVQLDITVVSRNDDQLSLFHYDGFNMTFEDSNATTSVPAPPPTEPPSTQPCFICGDANATIGNLSAILDIPDELIPLPVRDIPKTCDFVSRGGAAGQFSEEECTFIKTDADAFNVCQCSATPAETETPISSPTQSPEDTAECLVCGEPDAIIGDPTAILEIPDDFLPAPVQGIPKTCDFVNRGGQNGQFSQEQCAVIQSPEVDAFNLCQCTTPTEQPTEVFQCFVCGDADAVIGAPTSLLEIPDDFLPVHVRDISRDLRLYESWWRSWPIHRGAM